jgi:hypothetical protein
MRPELPSTAGQPLPLPTNSVSVPKVASNFIAESRAAIPVGPVSVDDRRGGQGMVDPKPENSESPAVSVGRRAAPRLRISLPGQLVAVDRVHTCILLNLSRTGAQVAVLESLREGEGAILRCGEINHFGIVARSEFGLNALEFDEPLSDAQVLEIRRYHENFEERERRALIETARKWVTGDHEDERPT